MRGRVLILHFSVHPRACGKYVTSPTLAEGIVRSPPHAGNTDEMLDASEAWLPLTPAHAGNTRARGMTPRWNSAHPRVRGKYYWERLIDRPERRSPPRTREIRRAGSWPEPRLPLTPAHAGNTNAETTGTTCQTAHPRARGKYSVSMTITASTNRSPPRTREIRRARYVALARSPLTPAHAGNTPGWRTHKGRSAAHPRARGKYMFIHPRQPVAFRSPPRTREIRG